MDFHGIVGRLLYIVFITVYHILSLDFSIWTKLPAIPWRDYLLNHVNHSCNSTFMKFWVEWFSFNFGGVMVSGCFLRDLWDRGSLAFLVGPPILILHVAPVEFFHSVFRAKQRETKSHKWHFTSLDGGWNWTSPISLKPCFSLEKNFLRFPSRGNWYFCNDATVAKCSLDDALKAETYVAFYRKIASEDADWVKFSKKKHPAADTVTTKTGWRMVELMIRIGYF